MSQALLLYAVEVVEGADTVTGRAGLPLVLETMRALGLDQAIAQHVRVRERQSGYTEVEKVEALVLLLAAGGDCLDDIAVLQADAGLRRLLGRRLPSADRLRHFLYACHDDALIAQAQAQRPPDRVAYIPAENATLQGLGRVNTALLHRVAAQGGARRPRSTTTRPSRRATSGRRAPTTKAGAATNPQRSTGSSRTSWWRTSTVVGMGDVASRGNGGRCVPTRLVLGSRLPCPASPVSMRRTPSTT